MASKVSATSVAWTATLAHAAVLLGYITSIVETEVRERNLLGAQGG